ncbi:hypothetical protein ACIOHS_48070 [Streptomyces sp. NPDC088253]|uniref:hypothetical protein n=1 Tax=Streptomyces sp. NPDC088253 TaxID=3365846 RepID=UPI0037F4C175
MEIIEVLEIRMELWEPDDPDQTETPWWGTNWVPVSGADGDDHFIDAGEGMWQNHLGDAAHDDQAYFLGWPTLGSWLHEVAEAMEHHDESWFGAVSAPKIDDRGDINWWD